MNKLKPFNLVYVVRSSKLVFLCNKFLRSLKGILCLYPLIFMIDLFSIVIPPYTLGAKNIASLRIYSNLNLPNSEPINSGYILDKSLFTKIESESV